MGSHRVVSTSDEDEDDIPLTRRTSRSIVDDNEPRRKKRKLLEDEDVEEDDSGKPPVDNFEEVTDHTLDDVQEDAKPVGEPVRFSGKGKGRRIHYEAFEFDGNQYALEDPVLLVPEDKEQKPYAAIIKDINQTADGSLMVTGQWFYRPEEAERKGGGTWQYRDARELFYSFHHDEVPAESVMHKCVVHFVPTHKQLPNRKQHPGFIVQKVYDTVERKLWNLTDKDYEDSKQREIDLLVQKTMARLGYLPDIEPENSSIDQGEQVKNRRLIRKNSVSTINVSKDETAPRSDSSKLETPGSCPSHVSRNHMILVKCNALTGDTHRDKWLEKLLDSVQNFCSLSDATLNNKLKEISVGKNDDKGRNSVAVNDCQEKDSKILKNFTWPDTAVSAVSALERAAHEALATDFQKYNQKLRQLSFNLKNNDVLAYRLLNGELQPSRILSMSPNELKEGLTSEETTSNEPEESYYMQMMDAKCSRCNKLKAGVVDIIHSGRGDRYQLECIACGNSWYASSDEALKLTMDTPSSATNVGTVPLATAKFEEVEKNMVNPQPAKAGESLKKTSEPFIPVLESQRSLPRSHREHAPGPARRMQ